MGLDLPSGAPAWLGWGLFILTAGALILREFRSTRTDAAILQKTRLEAQALGLDILSNSAESYERQIKAIIGALEANALRYTPEQLEALRRGWPDRPSTRNPEVAEHLAARERARYELPLVIDQLTAVQRRQGELTRDVSQGVVLRDSVLEDLRDKTETLATNLEELIRLVASSPRIHVVTAPPPEAAEGDILMLISPEHPATAHESPPS